jgi:hypothetical protein
MKKGNEEGNEQFIMKNEQLLFHNINSPKPS